MEISERAKNISPSLTLAITAKAKAMKAQGLDIVSFGAGEPDFNTPDYIIEAAKYALDKGMTKYTPVPGTLELRRAIADKLTRDTGVEYAPEQIVVSTGGKQTLRNACEALINPGDEVILPAPYWLTYPELIKMSGGKVVVLETTGASGFKMTAEQLEKAITP
ncbi:MAG TPA: aminotransferase class I/II-fold pyridoxal phosphate-dependent enzyme, partial [Candidatus Protoclostridium stercorigallinarum]|nr:aminotransferase class I/II-fold pyridoxal phosphate-dependent enzyme [Candidatus Protoclostridium stercorigallinarum]